MPRFLSHTLQVETLVHILQMTTREVISTRIRHRECDTQIPDVPQHRSMVMGLPWLRSKSMITRVFQLQPKRVNRRPRISQFPFSTIQRTTTRAKGTTQIPVAKIATPHKKPSIFLNQHTFHPGDEACPALRSRCQMAARIIP